jgi:hypothetical protein
MRLEILQTPDCPSAPLLQERLAEALAEQWARVDLVVRVVCDAEEARAVGMTGSPTLLVNGVDPFAEPDLLPGNACRLYPGDGGRTSGAPSVLALRQALLDSSTTSG